MTFQVPSSAPVRSDNVPRCLALRLGSHPVTPASLASLALGPEDDDCHLVAIGADGAITSFEFNRAEEMDLDNAQVLRRQHPEPLWDHYKDQVSDVSDSPAKEWLEKAKTKHKKLSLHDIWLGTRRTLGSQLTLIFLELVTDPQTKTPFTFEQLEQHLRELDAPLNSFVTL